MTAHLYLDPEVDQELDSLFDRDPSAYDRTFDFLESLEQAPLTPDRRVKQFPDGNGDPVRGVRITGRVEEVAVIWRIHRDGEDVTVQVIYIGSNETLRL